MKLVCTERLACCLSAATLPERRHRKAAAVVDHLRRGFWVVHLAPRPVDGMSEMIDALLAASHATGDFGAQKNGEARCAPR